MIYVLIIYSIFASIKWFSYRFALEGALYYIGENYGIDVLENLEIRDYIEEAIKGRFKK